MDRAGEVPYEGSRGADRVAGARAAAVAEVNASVKHAFPAPTAPIRLDGGMLGTIHGRVTTATDEYEELTSALAAFEGTPEMAELRVHFSDRASAQAFVDVFFPPFLQRFLRDVRRGKRGVWEAEETFARAQGHYQEVAATLSKGPRQESLRWLARFMLNPMFPDLVERVQRAIFARSERRVREDGHAALLVRWFEGLIARSPARAGDILDALWELDRQQREEFASICAELEPLDGIAVLKKHLAARRILTVYHALAERLYKPYAGALYAAARVGYPALKEQKGFGGAVWALRGHLEREWPGFEALVDTEVVFLRNAKAHTQFEPLLQEGAYLFRDQPSGGAAPKSLRLSHKDLEARADALARIVLPGGSVQRAVELLRGQAFVRHALAKEIEKMRAGIEADRARLTRFVNGEDHAAVFGDGT